MKKGDTPARITPAEIAQIRDQIVELISNKPEKAVVILSDWINKFEKNQARKIKKAG